MQLGDIDWSVGRVLIRGKGGYESYMPLPADVGEALVNWLRHGLAMSLLNKGNTLPEISDVLRHRRIQTTTVYARYDTKALRALACAWPIEGGNQ